jgi:hypothetical protein
MQKSAGQSIFGVPALPFPVGHKISNYPGRPGIKNTEFYACGTIENSF